MANDQAVEDILRALTEHVGMQMLRVEGLSGRSWRYVVLATPIADDALAPDMRVSFTPTDDEPHELRAFAAILLGVAQKLEAGGGAAKN